MLSRNTESHTFETIFVESLSKVGDRCLVWCVSCSGETREKDGCVCNGSGHRARRILTMSDWNNPCTADHAKRRLNADQRVCRRRTHNRAISFSANSCRTKICFTENDCAGFTEFSRDERVLKRLCSFQRE